MLKFPYGLADFGRIRTQGYVYVDRTFYLELTLFLSLLFDDRRYIMFSEHERGAGKPISVSSDSAIASTSAVTRSSWWD